MSLKIVLLLVVLFGGAEAAGLTNVLPELDVLWR